MNYEWPPLDDEVVTAVLSQLHTSTSIYGREGVFARFEDRFAEMHGCAYALLTSSGTAALHSAYYALGIGPGDEVICPAYTFFATATPLFQLGALPVLVDSTAEGLLDLGEVSRAITPRTKALVVSHMWGRPAPTWLYRMFCDARGLALVEDCSHAHGASFETTPAGSLADVSVWSLQAGKLIAAGEGGVLCTNDEDILVRATMLGHFNRRAMSVTPPDHPLRPYAETGLGLKYRAHPLGIAMAMVYLDRLDGWLDAKAANAARLHETLREFRWLRPLHSPPRALRDSHYAFPMVVADDEPESVVPEVVRRMREAGFTDFQAATSMRDLSSYHLFHAPRSPVAEYEGTSIRRPLRVAEHLSRAVVRIPVPATDDDFARRYLDTFAASVEKTARQLGNPAGSASGLDRAVVESVLEGARQDQVEQLVVGAVAWRVRQGEPEVLLALRRPDDFLGGFEELIGGGVEEGESLLQALHREVREEAGVEPAAVHRVLGTFDYTNEWHRKARQVNFDVELRGEPVLSGETEHTAFRWIRRSELDAAGCTVEVRNTLHWWFALWSSGAHRP